MAGHLRVLVAGAVTNVATPTSLRRFYQLISESIVNDRAPLIISPVLFKYQSSIIAMTYENLSNDRVQKFALQFTFIIMIAVRTVLNVNNNEASY